MNIKKYFKTNKELREEVEFLKSLIDDEREVAINMAAELEDIKIRSTVETVVEEMLDGGVNFYNINTKSKEKQRSYYAEAQNFLNSEFVQNETKAAISDLITKSAMSSKDFNDVENYRMTMIGMQLLIQRAKNIINPDAVKKPTKTDVHSAL